LLGGCSTIWVMFPALLALVLFPVWYHFCLGPAPDHDLPTYSLPHSCDSRSNPPCPAYWLRWSPTNFLPRMASNCHLVHLCLLSSDNYKCESFLTVSTRLSSNPGFLGLWIGSSVN
jgi:hypothetical protein